MRDNNIQKAKELIEDTLKELDKFMDGDPYRSSELSTYSITSVEKIIRRLVKDKNKLSRILNEVN